jgi:hypothetical protein
MIADILVLVFLTVFMFVPTLIARYRHLKKKVPCFWVNLFLGWTVLVWLPLLVWSIMTDSVE